MVSNMTRLQKAETNFGNAPEFIIQNTLSIDLLESQEINAIY